MKKSFQLSFLFLERFSVFSDFPNMEEFDENDIVDFTDNESEFTLDTSEEDEEDQLRELQLNEKCRLEQAVYDLKFKQQSKSITNLDVEVSY